MTARIRFENDWLYIIWQSDPLCPQWDSGKIIWNPFLVWLDLFNWYLRWISICHCWFSKRGDTLGFQLWLCHEIGSLLLVINCYRNKFDFTRCKQAFCNFRHYSYVVNGHWENDAFSDNVLTVQWLFEINTNEIRIGLYFEKYLHSILQFLFSQLWYFIIVISISAKFVICYSH